jgi:WD40 repeat protein/serine/threonine protein kinase
MANRDLSGRMLGEFVLCEQIGRGGYGAVYRCEQRTLNRHVVVKVLQRNDDIAEQRFLREAQLASRFEHPYAAHVYAFGVEGEEGLMWIAMELVQGSTLTAWLEQHGPMSLEQFVPFFECVAEVVHAAHASEIVHRDIKPSNVMVTERGGRLLPKLLDFGTAKVNLEEQPDGSLIEGSEQGDALRTDAAVTTQIRAKAQRVHHTLTDRRQYRITRTGVGFGSRPYMSPEQWNNAGGVESATDIYSLGVVAYEVLTGHLPFTAESTDEYHQKHCCAEVPSLGTGFSRDLDRVIQQALAKSPRERQSTALELASQLRAAMEAQPREQLRSLAKVWNHRERSSALLLKGGDLLRTPTEVIGELERAFVTASQRHAVRNGRIRRLVAASAAVLILVAVWYQGSLKTELAEQQARSARQVTEAIAAEAELEQGRAALLHHEPEAQLHLTEAYRRDRASSTGFMLARALQPRLAEQARLASSFGRMWSARFSPNGKELVTTDDQNAQIWDAQSYQLRVTLHHGDVVYQAVYSTDGSKLVTGSADGVVRIWDAASGTLVRELRRDGIPRLRYYIVALSPDNKLVAAIEMDGVVAHVWDASTGAPLAELHNEALGYSSLAFSSDGHWLATSGGNDVRVFDTRTWAQIIFIPRPGIYAMSWDPRDPRLLTGSADGDASIWEIPSGKRIHHLRETGEPVDAVAFSPDGQLVVSASRDGAEQIWEASSGKLRSQGNYLRDKILSVEFDPTSMLVVAAGANGAVAVTDASQGMPVTVLDGPRNVVLVAHFDPISRQVVGASWDGTARVWDATSPYRKWSSPPIGDDCGVTTSLEPDRRFLAIGCKNHPTRIWDTVHDRLLAELPSVTPVAGDFVSSYPAVSAAGDRAAIARHSTVEVYEVPGGQLLHTIAHGAPVNTVAFASTGRDIVSGALDGSVLVTRDSGALLTLPKSSGGIDAAAFLPDGRVVTVDAQQRLRVYDAGGAVLADIKMSARARTLRMSLDSRRLVTVPNFIGQVAPPELWDLEHYRSITQLEDHGQGQVYSARFVAGGQIITACADGAVRRWDGVTGRLQKTYRGGARFLADATLSPDGSMILAGGGDGLLRFWDAASGRALWTMLAHRSHLVGIRIEGDDIITRGFSGDLARWTLPKPELVIEACAAHDGCAMVLP